MSKMSRGSTYEKRSNIENACSIGLVKWYDNKAVTLASNFITSGTLDSVQRHDIKLNEYITVERPEIIKLHNANGWCRQIRPND